MKTIKIIDLLNKIANGEITELHKFKWNERIWEEYSKFEEINNEKSYQEHRKNGTSFMRFENICDARHFNDEVEIIEEEQKDNFTGWKMYQDGKEVMSMDCSPEEDKKIEKLDVALLGQCDNWLQNRVVNTRLDIELNPYIIENIRENTLHFQRGINELRDEINKLKKLIDETNRLKEEK